MGGLGPMPMPMGGASAAPPPASSGTGTPPPLASAPQQQGADPQAQVQGAIKQFQDIHAQIQALAQQFPELAEDAKAALDDLNTGMVKVISNIQGGSEVPSPAMAS